MEPWAAGHPEHRASAAPPPLADPGTAGAAVKTIGSLNNSIVPAISSLYLGCTTPFVVKLHNGKSFFKEIYYLIKKLSFSSP